MARFRPPRIPSGAITDEAVYLERRRLLAALAAAPALGLGGCAEAEPPPPAARAVGTAEAAAGFRTDEPLTRYEDATTYNNFYEFGTRKDDPSRAPRTLRTTPWTVVVDGECGRPGRIGLEDLLRGLRPEERVYRLRCVEGWSMVVPWLGVPLGMVLRRFQPPRRRNTWPSPPWPTRSRCRASASARSAGRTARACASTRPCTR